MGSELTYEVKLDENTPFALLFAAMYTEYMYAEGVSPLLSKMRSFIQKECPEVQHFQPTVLSGAGLKPKHWTLEIAVADGPRYEARVEDFASFNLAQFRSFLVAALKIKVETKWVTSSGMVVSNGITVLDPRMVL